MVAERLFCALCRDGGQQTRLLPCGALTTTLIYQNCETVGLLTRPRPRRLPHLPSLVCQDSLFAQRRVFSHAAFSPLRGSAYGATYDSPHALASSRLRCSMIRAAALPSHFGGLGPFFHCSAINRANAGGSLPGSVPMSWFVPTMMV